MRLTPSASAFAQAVFGLAGAAGAGGFSGILVERAAVISTSFSRAGAGLAAVVAGGRSASRAATVCGAATSARGEEVQNQTPAIATAAATLTSIRPNALRIDTLSTNKFSQAINM